MNSGPSKASWDLSSVVRGALTVVCYARVGRGDDICVRNCVFCYMCCFGVPCLGCGSEVCWMHAVVCCAGVDRRGEFEKGNCGYYVFQIARPGLWDRSLLEACGDLLGCLSGPFWRRLGGLSGPLGGLLVPPWGLPGVSEGI